MRVIIVIIAYFMLVFGICRIGHSILEYYDWFDSNGAVGIMACSAVLLPFPILAFAVFIIACASHRFNALSPKPQGWSRESSIDQAHKI